LFKRLFFHAECFHVVNDTTYFVNPFSIKIVANMTIAAQKFNLAFIKVTDKTWKRL
tara:strand:- start:631 stop:798 length:168 start_codon:yes stop_codon:yes gene_type:complete